MSLIIVVAFIAVVVVSAVLSTRAEIKRQERIMRESRKRFIRESNARFNAAMRELYEHPINERVNH